MSVRLLRALIGERVSEAEYKAVSDLMEQVAHSALARGAGLGAAKGWDEGYAAGFADADFTHLGLSTDPEASEHPVGNPYQASRRRGEA